MTRRLPPTTGDASESLSRKRTAEMLRKLRALTAEVKMLKARIDQEGMAERKREMLARRSKRDAN